jgi:hypothetical protein
VSIYPPYYVYQQSWLRDICPAKLYVKALRNTLDVPLGKTLHSSPRRFRESCENYEPIFFKKFKKLHLKLTLSSHKQRLDWFSKLTKNLKILLDSTFPHQTS